MRASLRIATALFGLSLATQPFAANPTTEEVGDADTFGKNVKYMGGILIGGTVLLRASCAGVEVGPRGQCFELAPGDALTSFDARDLGSVTLPPRSTVNLILPLISPTANFQFLNPGETGVPNARFNFNAYFTLESEALNDPSLINLETGQPFNGKADLNYPGNAWDRSLSAGERARQVVTYTRSGITGSHRLVLTGALGIPDAVVDRIFRGPITLRTNIRGTARYVSDATLFVGARFFGD